MAEVLFVFSSQEIRCDSQKIGKGSFSKVYEGIILSKEVPCAVKKFIKEKVKVKQIRKEACTWKDLSHERIVTLYGVWSADSEESYPSLILEKMDLSLTSYLEKHQGLQFPTKGVILLHVAEGLDFLNSKDLIHGDLTANNVLLRINSPSNISAKISDFGISRMVSPAIYNSSVQAGTEYYMPPEMLEDPPSPSLKVDSFSFGVLILHTMNQTLPKPLPGVVTQNEKRLVRSEFQRRVSYFSLFSEELAWLKRLAQQCLENNCVERPDSKSILKCFDQFFQRRQVNVKLGDITVCEDNLGDRNVENACHTSSINSVVSLVQEQRPVIQTLNLVCGNTFENCTVEIGKSPNQTTEKMEGSSNSSGKDHNSTHPHLQRDTNSTDGIESRKLVLEPVYRSNDIYHPYGDQIMVGTIIGTKGANMKEIKQTTGAHVFYDTEKICFVIKGKDAYIRERGLQELKGLIHLKEVTTATKENLCHPFDGDKSVLGLIIGANGTNMKSIHKVTGARIYYDKGKECFVIEGKTSDIRQQGLSKLDELIQQKIASKNTKTRTSSIAFSCDYEEVESVELPSDVCVGRVFGRKRNNVNSIESETETSVLFTSYYRAFIISGHRRKEAATMICTLINDNRNTDKDSLRETSTHDDPKRQDLFQRNLLLPGDLCHSMFCGHKHNNIQYIKTLDGCYVDIDMPSNSGSFGDVVTIRAKSLEECKEGYEEAMIVLSKVMGAILPSKDWYKKVYFLTELDRKASVSMVPYSKCYSPATASTKDFQVMQLESSIQSEHSEACIKTTPKFKLLKEKLQEILLPHFETDCKGKDHFKSISLKIEGKLGKVLWNTQRAEKTFSFQAAKLSDCIPVETFFKDDLPCRHIFKPSMAAQIVDRQKNKLQMEKLGEETILKIRVVLTKGKLENGAYPLINIKCRKVDTSYEIIDISRKKRKEVILDGIFLEGSLDLRIVCSSCTDSDAGEILPEYIDIGKKVLDGIHENVESGKLSIIPRHETFAVTYLSKRKLSVYQYNYEGRPYLLTYIDKGECSDGDFMRGLGPLTKQESTDLEWIYDSLLMVDNPQWLIDFAQLNQTQARASTSEVFKWSSCQPPKGFHMEPKLPTLESVLQELEHFVRCVWHISHLFN